MYCTTTSPIITPQNSYLISTHVVPVVKVKNSVNVVVTIFFYKYIFRDKMCILIYEDINNTLNNN